MRTYMYIHRKCYELFKNEADRKLMIEGRLNYNAMSAKERSDVTFNRVRDLCLDAETSRISKRIDWVFLGDHLFV